MTPEGSRSRLNLRSAYLSAVAVVGVAAIVLLFPQTIQEVKSGGLWGFIVFLCMGVLSEWAYIPLARGAMSLSYAVVLPTFVLYGAGAAVIVEVVGYLLGTLEDKRGWRVRLFNCGQYALTVLVAASAYDLIGGVRAAQVDTVSVLQLCVFTAVYFVINHGLVGVWFTLTHPDESAKVIWGEPAKWEGLTYLITAPLGVTVISLYSMAGLIGAVALFVVSFVAAFIFRLAFRLDNLNHELRTLYESAQALGQGLDLETVKGKVLDILERLAPSPLVQLFLWDDVGQVLRAVGGRPEASGLEGSCHRLGEGLIGGVAERRSVEVFQEVSGDLQLSSEAGWQSPASMVVVPMATEESLVGVLVLAANQPGRYSEEHVRLLTIFAAQAGAALSRAMRFQETRQMAITDSKTGVYNYRFFYERLIDEIRRHEAKDRPFSLIFVDVDYLKGINDRFGHQVGDEVLVQVATLIKESVRDSDEVARYGGEEFVILLPGASGAESLAVAERIRQSVENHEFASQYGFGPVRVTVTAGVATYPEHATQPDELIFRADEAMYHGKHRGRNRVSLYAAVARTETGLA